MSEIELYTDAPLPLPLRRDQRQDQRFLLHLVAQLARAPLLVAQLLSTRSAELSAHPLADLAMHSLA
eukprot:CAMPEP_0197859756 /NCGR_PEP_ID=MMETSP1438-20131217/34606_1 /TAXON_ID=1461541 /ORGANISM="Pterosperma sp., Strain CCMP1384" /LENGTH=66 /DNA_ID=CAMNT_0043476381 /DNA_START=140 /DNA_END=336 /DNA_ORIENTATION=-